MQQLNIISSIEDNDFLMDYSMSAQNQAKQALLTQNVAKQSLNRTFLLARSESDKHNQRTLEKQRSQKVKIDALKSEITVEKSQSSKSEWETSQIRDLFKYYDQFGSRWSQMQAYFINKTQNNIKNKFYGYLKMILRHIFKELDNVSGQKIKHLSATQLTEIYEGTRKYRKFKDLIKNCMKEIQYQITRRQIKSFVQQNQEKIRELYMQISGLKKDKKEEQRVKEQVLVQNNQQNTHKIQNRQLSFNFNNQLTQVDATLYPMLPANRAINPFLQQQHYMSLFTNPFNHQFLPNMLSEAFDLNQILYWMSK